MSPAVSILIRLASRSAVTVKPVPLRRTKRWQPESTRELVCVMEVQPDELAHDSLGALACRS